MPFEDPHLMYAGRGQYATTNEPEYVGRTHRIKVARGFRTDLATVPRIFWALIPPFGAYEAAAVLHDWLLKGLQEYHQAVRRYEAPVEPLILSTDIDGLFRRVMKEAGVGFVTRWVMWTGVRWGAMFSSDGYRRGGWWSWPEAPLVLLITAAGVVVAAVPLALLVLIGKAL